MILPNFILAQSQQATEMGLDQKIDKAFKPFSDFVSNVVFFEVFNGAPLCIKIKNPFICVSRINMSA